MPAMPHWLKDLLRPDVSGAIPAPLRLFRQARRFVTALLRDVNQGGLDLWATSLVYTSLLSMAPLLAVSFSVLKAFGAHNQLQPFLLQMLEPLGDEQAAEISGRIIGFVNNLEVGVLGFTGFALLFWTVLALLKKTEDCFNTIWQVRQARGLRQRFADYLSVLLVGPVLLFSAAGMSASMASHRIVKAIVGLEPFGMLYVALGKVLPTLLMIAAFTFLYAFITNTKVSFRAALAGGLFAGVAWKLAAWLFGTFMAGSAQYAAIYSSFAILILFMMWLYFNWLIMLLGVDISFYFQHPRQLRAAQREVRLGSWLFRRLGLLVIYLLAERFHRGAAPWTLNELVARLDLPSRVVERILENLQQRGLVLPVSGVEDGWVPARDSSELPLTEILSALEAEPEDGYRYDCPALAEPAVDDLLASLRGTVDGAVDGMTLEDLVTRGVRGQE